MDHEFVVFTSDASTRKMIYRTNVQASVPADSPAPAWQLFVASQQAAFTHLISQPAHAALAGQLAGFLRPTVFGSIPQEVIDIIGRHDRGWFEADSTALERASHTLPTSFLSVAPEDAVQAWRSSIRSAERQSLLAGILTSRRFCLLAPQNDSVHHQFWQEETERRELLEKDYSSPADLDRLTAAMGFCDLLSLFLCCGWSKARRFPWLTPPIQARKKHRS
jgi:hypothetical protein